MRIEKRNDLNREGAIRSVLLDRTANTLSKTAREIARVLPSSGPSLLADIDEGSQRTRDLAILDAMANRPETAQVLVSEYDGCIELKIRVPVVADEVLEMPPGYGSQCVGGVCRD